MKKGNLNKYFLLFSNCIVVSDQQRSVIYDLQRGTYIFIPRILSKIVDKARNKSINEVCSYYEYKYDRIINSFFENLYLKGLGFYTYEPKLFPKMNLKWDSPYLITNIIIDCDNEHIVSSFIKMIDDIGSESVQLRVNDIDCLGEVLKKMDTTRVRSIEVWARYISKEFSNKIISICENHYKVRLVYFDNATELDVNYINKANMQVLYNRKSSESNMEANQRNQFVINLPFFSESQLHNTYFNRKLYIGSNGQIKNSPDSKHVYGYVNKLNKNDFKKIIKSTKFKKLWFFHKKLIDVCRDCVFRNICIDSRTPIQRKSGGWFFAEECNYNPYIAKWKGEDGYKPLIEIGVTSNKNGFSISKQKLSHERSLL